MDDEGKPPAADRGSGRTPGSGGDFLLVFAGLAASVASVVALPSFKIVLAVLVTCALLASVPLLRNRMRWSRPARVVGVVAVAETLAIGIWATTALTHGTAPESLALAQHRQEALPRPSAAGPSSGSPWSPAAAGPSANPPTTGPAQDRASAGPSRSPASTGSPPSPAATVTKTVGLPVYLDVDQKQIAPMRDSDGSGHLDLHVEEGSVAQMGSALLEAIGSRHTCDNWDLLSAHPLKFTPGKAFSFCGLTTDQQHVQVDMSPSGTPGQYIFAVTCL